VIKPTLNANMKLQIVKRKKKLEHTLGLESELLS
jgi:hypothetical protein